MKPFLHKYLATILGFLIATFPWIIQFFDKKGLFGFIFFGSTLLIYALIGQILSTLQLEVNISIFFSTLLYLLFFVPVCVLYYKKIKKDKALDKFRVLPLLLFYFVQFFIIHQLLYSAYCLIISTKMDANDFMGVIKTGFYSGFAYIIFGIVIDYLKNEKSTPQISL